jgi:hypothetical protein
MVDSGRTGRIVVVPTSGSDDHPQGSVCPECREPLLANLKTGRFAAEGSFKSETTSCGAVQAGRSTASGPSTSRRLALTSRSVGGSFSLANTMGDAEW